MNLLDKYLWKPATDIKPESLIGKQCREKKSGRVLLVQRYSDMFRYYVCRTSEGYIKHCFSEDIEFLDESPEGIRELKMHSLQKATEKLNDSDQWFLNNLYAIIDSEAHLAAKENRSVNRNSIINWLTSNPNEHTKEA